MAHRKSPAKAAAEVSAAATPSFEEALERLETIVDELEGGSLSLEESISRYEEGVKLSRRLTQTLDHAEKRIERLIESEGDEAPTTEPMELDEGSGDTPRAPAGQSKAPERAEGRRSNRVGEPPETDELPF